MQQHILPREVFNVVKDHLDDNFNFELRDDYEGRAAYGTSCLALTCEGVSGLVRFTFALMELISTIDADDANAVSELVEAMREGLTQADDYGSSTLFYWPRVAVAPAT
jgi:hypothetical protein